jgi:prolyl oligopeptidase
VVVSRDGHWAVASQYLTRPRPVAVLDLHHRGSQWRSVLPGFDEDLFGHAIGDEYIGITTRNAPRGQVVAVSLVDAGAEWKVVVPESEAVLRSVTPVGELLYVAELVDTYARVRIVDRSGKALGTVPLPSTRSALSQAWFPLSRCLLPSHPNEYLFASSTLIDSWAVYRHRPGETGVETLREAAIRLDAVAEDLWATSRDGTRVPYHVVGRRDRSRGPQPALIWAYGGYGFSLLPEFPSALAAFIDAGGLFVHAHIRGGGDLGLDWWEGGRMRNKQNGYDDLYAIAEDLIARGRATPGQLAVIGDSNGGLMAGVAVTQRPELWRAAVLRGPWLDLLGGCREPYLRWCFQSELGDPGDPDDIAHFAALSPYQAVVDGTAYPAVYIDAGATDPRVPAWQARKFAARLQEATTSNHPVFLRVWEHAGHGQATAADIGLAQTTGWLAFLIDQLGLGG